MCVQDRDRGGYRIGGVVVDDDGCKGGGGRGGVGVCGGVGECDESLGQQESSTWRGPGRSH